MPETIELPYYTIDATELAKWFADQPDAWWNVDGDPVLTSLVDFPCPSDEIAEEVRRIAKVARVFDSRKAPKADGSPISLAELNALANTENNSNARTFLLRWEDGDLQWLLAEDPDAAKDAA